MTNIKDIDIAIRETLKKHPTNIIGMSNMIFNAIISNKIRLDYITNTNMARLRMARCDSTDLTEYLLKNAIKILIAAPHILEESNISKNSPNYYEKLNELFPNYNKIYGLINNLATNYNTNSILYLRTSTLDLNDLTNFVFNTLFNLQWYYKNGNYEADLENNTTKIREVIEKYGRLDEDKLSTLLQKVDHDIDEVKPFKNININYTAHNRCLREVLTNTQVKYRRSNYILDGTLYAAQDIGKVRQNQEDSVIILTHPDNQNFKLLAVADGMGGFDKGEFASNFTLKEISNWFINLPANAYYYPAQVQENYKNVLKEISQKLYNQCYGKSGTTYVGAIVTESNTIIANVGDSRAYMFKGPYMKVATRDESYVWDMSIGNKDLNDVNDPELDRLSKMPQSNVINRSIGDANLGDPAITILNNDYDMLLLLSDGITDLLSQNEIRIISQKNLIENIPKLLIEQALNKSVLIPDDDQLNGNLGKDNASVAMYRR